MRLVVAMQVFSDSLSAVYDGTKERTERWKSGIAMKQGDGREDVETRGKT